MSKKNNSDPYDMASSNTSDSDIEVDNLNHFADKNKSDLNFENTPLSRTVIKSLIALCKNKCEWSKLTNLLESTFSSWEILSKCFLRGSDSEELFSCNHVEKADAECNEKEYGIYSSVHETYTVDIQTIRKSFEELFSLDIDSHYVIKKSINQLLRSIKKSNSVFQPSNKQKVMNILLILFELPSLTDPKKFEDILPQVCEIVSLLKVESRAVFTEILAKVWKETDQLKRLHDILQQRLTLRLITVEHSTAYSINRDKDIINTVYVLQCVYYASILAGKIDSLQQMEHERIYFEEINSSIDSKDEMSEKLLVHSMDCRHPLIPYNDFINETLNEAIDVAQDFICFKACSDLSFVKYPFLLSIHTKSKLFFYDNRIRMDSEDRKEFIRSLLSPLKLTLNRENIIEDTLNWLERNQGSLKRRLYIEFKNEETSDEGGVSKEFFQLIVEKIFNPDYGMFIYNEETHMFWFNPFPMDDMSREYKLIGMILGLAIYNNVILNLQLPHVLYRKLIGKLGNFEDLKCTHPGLVCGLTNLLECEPEEVVSLDLCFQITMTDSFGNQNVIDLKENGSAIPLTADNREEYVELYADYLLNESVKDQFNAFYMGFQMIVHESPLKLLFRPDEIELLVCGSKSFNFHELEKVTRYEGGFNSCSETIINFWKIVHEMTPKQHSQLLEFTTGSDRIPVGGMQKMDFKIIRHGPDTNRLPTAHTCFNILLLPDYRSKEKLETNLLKAISYSKGFGLR